ncbi:hypothetical protein FHP25_22120 [Vineibacter terrae]|uniref:Uncharacterized protein n=1 Tax=Vineibacter terrae TaxID=2586908 RepID=A0A5C8PI06_9HYPH|nr:hypothetical protein FHP25_22120 [Vineibacter terrae]
MRSRPRCRQNIHDGELEGRFFHGYYDCHCYMPLYVFCGRHLSAAGPGRQSTSASCPHWAHNVSFTR